MTDSTKIAATVEVPEVAKAHPLMRSHMLVSTKHIDYEALDAFEAITLSVVLFLAVTAGTLMATVLS